jgi:gamma-glutamylaminecyclotransferase
LRIEGKEEKKILKKERERERKPMGIKTENISNHASTKTLIFTHKTLKRGFSNHVLMQDLIKTGDVVFNGIYRNEQGSLRRGCRVWGRGVLRAVRHRSYAIEIAFSCYLCLQFCILHPSSASF